MNNTLLNDFNKALELVEGDRGAAAQIVLASVLRESCTDRPMTVPEVAKFLRVRPDKVLSWIRSGRLRGYNVAEHETGRPKYRVNPADLEAFTRCRMPIQPAPKGRPAGRRRFPQVPDELPTL
jgi:excisionase family DNA binding protein